MGAIIVKVGTETKKVAIDIPPNYNPIRFNDAGTVRGCRLVRPRLFNATPVHTMVDGRVMALAGNVKVNDFDTWIERILDQGYPTSAGLTILVNPLPETRRSYIKCPVNKKLNLYCYSEPGTGAHKTIEVREVDPASFDILTLKWSNQPALGTKIYSYDLSGKNLWDEFPTGSAGAICIKYEEEITPQYFRSWYSSNYYNPIFRPSFTDP